MSVAPRIGERSCPVVERTRDGRSVGRCWFFCPDGVCPRHGDVSVALERYRFTGRLTDEGRLEVER